jgi:hypothetical protein
LEHSYCILVWDTLYNVHFICDTFICLSFTKIQSNYFSRIVKTRMSRTKNFSRTLLVPILNTAKPRSKFSPTWRQAAWNEWTSFIKITTSCFHSNDFCHACWGAMMLRLQAAIKWTYALSTLDRCLIFCIHFLLHRKVNVWIVTYIFIYLRFDYISVIIRIN